MSTIEKVAKKAGVSVATVSRVINKSNLVKSETEARVKQAIRELHYVPNLSARNLRRRESRIVMILVPNYTNPYYSRVLSGISDAANQFKYSPLIVNTRDASMMEEKDILEHYQSSRADGMILLACNRDDTWINKYARDIPILQCSEYVDDSSIPHISVDNYAASYDMVSEIIKRGHSRIAMISSKNHYMSTKLRREGYLKALADAGITPREDYIGYGDEDYSLESGKLAAAKLMALEERPTAVFCVSDVLALGAVAKAQEMGIRVPDELSVAGFDDVDYTTIFHPYITTVKVPCYELGFKAMELLIQKINKHEPKKAEVYMPHTLIMRESLAESPHDKHRKVNQRFVVHV